jgi:hypothetical protein
VQVETPTEDILGRICRHSFLSLWSHPHPYRNTTPVPHELCDVLVVFGDDVIVFSDKSIKFPGHQDLGVAWGRWYRRAVVESTKQLHGAARWLREHPARVFADIACTAPLRAPLPDPQTSRYHLVAVAWGANQACYEFHGGQSSSSLMIESDLVGDEHLTHPFSIGRANERLPFVHVFDEPGLKLVMHEVDTARDFADYLTKRTELLTNPDRVIIAPGEEELLAGYLTNTDARGSHSFLSDEEARLDVNGMAIAEGGWERYVNHPQRRAKKQADRISYLWDRLVEHFIKELPERGRAMGEGSLFVEREVALRVMASESRFSRRMYATHLSEVMERTRNLSPRQSLVRVGFIRERPQVAYLFLVLAPDPTRSREEYEAVRAQLLRAYCHVLCLELPETKEIVGIGMVPPTHEPASEALCYTKNDDRSDAFREEGRLLQRDLNILVDIRERLIVERTSEYPDPQPPV